MLETALIRCEALPSKPLGIIEFTLKSLKELVKKVDLVGRGYFAAAGAGIGGFTGAFFGGFGTPIGAGIGAFVGIAVYPIYMYFKGNSARLTKNVP